MLYLILLPSFVTADKGSSALMHIQIHNETDGNTRFLYLYGGSTNNVCTIYENKKIGTHTLFIIFYNLIAQWL